MADQNGNGGTGAEVAVVMVPLPAQGHLNQLLHLSRLISSYNIPVYYTGAATHVRQVKLRVQGWDPHSTSKLHFHEFQTPSFDSPAPEPKAKSKSPTQLVPSFLAILHLRDPLREFLSNLSQKTRRVVVIYDSWMVWNVQDVPSIPNAESYSFHSVSAFALYSFIWEMTQRPPLPPEAEILNHVDLIPGVEDCINVEFEEYNKFQHEAKKFNSGSLFNSSRVIEEAFIDLLAKQPLIGTGQQYWVIGPFNPVSLPENELKDSGIRHKCLAWLDKQEQNSVIFISFGSTTTLTDEQIEQIAIGLAESEQKFIWVLREADKGDVFVGNERRFQLPEGLEDGIEGKGMILRDWAPQLEILAHPATGGFMSHCGWNSCMEGISLGVPIATWPMHSDQPRNALLINKLLKIGVEVDNCTGQLVSSSRIAEAVKKLMASPEGDEIRSRAEEVSRAIKLSVMDGGASRVEMDSFISHITRE